MTRWAGIALMMTALGLMAQGALADGTRSRPSPGSTTAKRVPQSHPHPSQRAHAPQQAGRHQHSHRWHVPRPATLVVIPSVVPRPFYYAPAPLFVAPPAYTAPLTYAAPPVYTAPPALAEGQGYAPETSPYLFFCPDSRRYYPDVRECPSGWLAVVPGVPGPPN